MSDVQQDRRDSPDEKPPAPYPSHGAIAAPQRRPRVRTLIVRGLALAAISAAVGAAVALLALPLGINRQLAAPPYAKTQSTVNPSVEQVASKVLPSVVTMTTELGGGELHCLVHPLRDGTHLSVRSSPARSGLNLPVSSVEEVAAKVLPSVVTLQGEVGGQSYLGVGHRPHSGWAGYLGASCLGATSTRRRTGQPRRAPGAVQGPPRRPDSPWAAIHRCQLGGADLARGFDVVATDPAPNAGVNLRAYVDAAWFSKGEGLSRDRERAYASRKTASTLLPVPAHSRRLYG
jgi:hypothetical protein